MTDKVRINARNRQQTTKVEDQPNRIQAATKRAAVAASTNGYWKEMRWWQARQRPLRSKKLKTGMLSPAEIGFEQFGQRERGRITDNPRGVR
jgi:hypothetical protein